ncbi:Hypothetical_protein [Hexamita inflata]|uniref:Hypothetical_protein n=1 Tax=Hexamita inflata TaxID=28002 RepID=A0AA86U495_9EUKA|nr:Hypothetical protein HINF_LOCUS29532 [Hexamita inflata]CAI9941890.1 Hypothetical protein HINF_LOCUS29535 [Hexamita inflata]
MIDETTIIQSIIQGSLYVNIKYYTRKQSRGQQVIQITDDAQFTINHSDQFYLDRTVMELCFLHVIVQLFLNTKQKNSGNICRTVMTPFYSFQISSFCIKLMRRQPAFNKNSVTLWILQHLSSVTKTLVALQFQTNGISV